MEQKSEREKELEIILFNLRSYTKAWNIWFGFDLKQDMQFWEKRADNWIEKNITFKKDTDEKTEK